MSGIKIFDRKSKRIVTEKVYGERSINFLYEKNFVSKFVLFLTKFPNFSKLYGFIQKTKFSKCKILPFIKKFDIDTSELVKDVSKFTSFNDFFIRKINLDKRPLVKDDDICVCPADGRYRVFPKIEDSEPFYVKGKKFSLEEFLQDEKLAKKYINGSMVIIRLNPTDYHRIHFPIDCIPSSSKLINGYLFSVNPIAIINNCKLFYQNKRELTTLKSEKFGDVLLSEIGATGVGSINQTFGASSTYTYKKGEQKSYFSFGGSSVIMLFEPNMITFADDLLKYSEKGIEVKAQVGQKLASLKV
jgi:phosphatidylserine decarboxylase